MKPLLSTPRTSSQRTLLVLLAVAAVSTLINLRPSAALSKSNAVDAGPLREPGNVTTATPTPAQAGLISVPTSTPTPTPSCPGLPNPRYVDAGATDSGDGSSAHPFNKVILGAACAPTNGSVVIRPGLYPEALFLPRPMTLQSSGGAVTIGAGVAPRPLNCAPGSPPFTDADGDGIIDGCEQTLADKYAPIVYHSSDESNLPTNVDWFLPKTSLWFYDDDCWPDLHSRIITAPTQGQLLVWSYQGGCGASDTVYSNGTRSNRKQRTFYLNDVAESYRAGSLDSRDWTTYYHAYLNNIGGVTIQYWRFYAYNDAANNHGGDWEGIHMVLDANLQPARVGFMGHTSIDYKQPSEVQWEGAHPRIYSEGGGHGSRPDGSGIYALGCTAEPTGINPNNPCTFIRQETWANGQVRWCNNPTVGFCNGAVTSAGSLVNVGSKIAPMNGQVFIQYSGIWGSPGTFYETSGYWCPAFNETGMLVDGFITAWCDGILNVDAGKECYPTARSR
jgi:hypothetical protein